MLFLEYPPCSTCKKAKNWLMEHGVEFTARHIKEENPTAEELSGWQEKSGLELKKFFNTSGMIYRDLGLKDKLPGMSRRSSSSFWHRTECWSSGPSSSLRIRFWWASRRRTGRSCCKNKGNMV